MSGFQFSPAGIIPLPPPGNAGEADDALPVAPGGMALQNPLTVVPVERLALPRVGPRTLKSTFVDALRPIDVVKLARKRLREVERDIRRLHALEKERDELRRLLVAAADAPKSRANVRDISVAKRG